jgi:uncharacterized lipoprotein YajG
MVKTCIMKCSILFLLIAVTMFTGCGKKKCTTAMVVKTSNCAQWGIRINTAAYPADTIPDVFKIDGARFCV